MTFEHCNGNFNYMYEWKIGEEWYPCHLYDMKAPEGCVCIFTRNGTIMFENCGKVRKISKEKYIKLREKNEIELGDYFTRKGYHKILDEDLKLWEIA